MREAIMMKQALFFLAFMGVVDCSKRSRDTYPTRASVISGDRTRAHTQSR